MTIDHLLKLRQARQEAEDTLKARYSFEARIAYDNAARAFEYALSVAAEDLLKMVEALERISNSTGCVEACPCWAKLRRQARAAIAAAKGADK